MRRIGYKKFNRVAVLLLAIVILFTAVLSGCQSDLKKASKGLTHYKIIAKYDEFTQTITANESVKYVNCYDTPLEKVQFHIYPNAYRKDAKIKPINEKSYSDAYPNGESYGEIMISSVRVSGKSAQFSIDGEDKNILTVRLPMQLYPSASFTIDIDFVLRLPNILHRLGYNEHTVNLGNWYPIACVYENGGFVTYAYYSNGDPFYSQIANYEVELTLPSAYLVASTGRTVGTELRGHQKTLKYEALAVRDFALVLSKEFKTLTKTAQKDVSITYYYYDDICAEESLQAAIDAVNTFSTNIGPYQYPTLSIVQTPFVHAGMEYPALIYVSPSVKEKEMYKEVIVHEVAHQWWYAAVGNDQVRYAWLDEGLTEYTTTLFYEWNKSYGQDAAMRVVNDMQAYLMFVDLYRSVHGDIDTSMSRPSYAYKNEYEYVYMTYVKGELMFDNLRKIMGDKAFFAALKKYYKEYMFKVAKPYDLIGAFEDASKKDLEKVFVAWISGEIVLGG